MILIWRNNMHKVQICAYDKVAELPRQPKCDITKQPMKFQFWTLKINIRSPAILIEDAKESDHWDS